jgi:hypothetical protein
MRGVVTSTKAGTASAAPGFDEGISGRRAQINLPILQPPTLHKSAAQLLQGQACGSPLMGKIEGK